MEKEKNNIENINKSIKDNIRDFFDKNEKNCLKQLYKAENKNIGEIYKSIPNNEIERQFKDANVLILTANKYETNILHQNIVGNRKIKKVEINYFNSRYYFYFFSWGKYKVAHIMANSTGSNTIDGSEDMIRLAFQYTLFKPLAIISFGICFGINHKNQRLGDVIISEKVYSYGEGLKIKDDKLEIIDNNNFTLMESLRQSMRNLINLNVISEQEGEYFGNYITGEAVMSNEKFKQDIVKSVTTNKILAGEMEGYGIFKECLRYGRNGDGQQKVPCIIIKAICDWGAQKNGFLNTLNIKSELQDNIFYDSNCDVKSYQEVVRNYYSINNMPFLDDIRMDEVEAIIKNSIQAYASNKAYLTCNKLFQHKSYFFGKPVKKKIIEGLIQYKKNNLSIYGETLRKIMGDVNEEEYYILLKELLDDNKIFCINENENPDEVLYKINF